MGMVGADRSLHRCRVSGGRGQSGDLVLRGESDGHLLAVLLSGESMTTWPKVRASPANFNGLLYCVYRSG